MKNVKIIIVVCLSFVFIDGFSQVNYQQNYLNAKEFFNDGKYSLAMETFKPLLEPSDNNPFATYASFYYALAAYHDGYPALAKDMLLQVKNRFPKWSKQNEVNYWLGKIYLESEEYNQSLNVLKQITDQAFQEDIYNLKYHHFSQLGDIDRLTQLYNDNPEEKGLGEALARKITKQSLVDQDQELLDELIEKFNLEEVGLTRAKVEKTVYKDSYRVAVLFPFLVDNLAPNQRKKVNQLVLDTYQGIQLAVDSLKKQGVKLELYAYDTKGESKATRVILEKDELKSMDLIIGPLFSEVRKLVQEFSFVNKINMINPLSSDSEVVGDNPYSFLFHPSNETIGRNAAEYIADKVKNKNGIIFYGETKADSAMAMSYKKRIEEKGFKIIVAKEIKKNDTREILNMLLNSNRKIGGATGDDIDKPVYKIQQDSLGHIFVASDNNLISSKVISAVETRTDSILVIGSSEWLNLASINFTVYKRLGAMLYAPLYIKKETEAYEHFREAYVLKHKVPPSGTSEIGYDLMMLLGNSLQKYGKYFQIEWNKQHFMKGHLTTGYSYHHSQDNGVVPILFFGEDGFEVNDVIEEDIDLDEDTEK